MDQMFRGASSFKAEDIGAWDLRRHDDASDVRRRLGLNRDIGAWDTSGVTAMYRMFLALRPLTRTSVIGRSTASLTWH